MPPLSQRKRKVARTWYGVGYAVGKKIAMLEPEGHHAPIVSGEIDDIRDRVRPFRFKIVEITKGKR